MGQLTARAFPATCVASIVSSLKPVEIDALVRAAREVRSRAYAPYSGYLVGAALRANDGRIFTGVNVENSAYPTSMCAERNALATAVGVGVRDFVAVAVVTAADDSGRPGSPCGACRQALAEFGLGVEVILATEDGNDYMVMGLDELLPHAFSGKNL
jgi:cytidine deaminase